MLFIQFIINYCFINYLLIIYYDFIHIFTSQMRYNNKGLMKEKGLFGFSFVICFFPELYNCSSIIGRKGELTESKQRCRQRLPSGLPARHTAFF